MELFGGYKNTVQFCFLCSAIFMRTRKCSGDRKVENRKGDCILPQEETREKNLEERREINN